VDGGTSVLVPEAPAEVHSRESDGVAGDERRSGKGGFGGIY